MKIYCQGKIVLEAEAKISARDHGFLYGATLFETFRTYQGKPFLLEEHLERLAAGCRAFGILPHADLLAAHPTGYRALRKLIQDLLAENGLSDAVFRYTLSAGEAPGGLPDSDYLSPTEILFVRPLPASPQDGLFRLFLLMTPRTEPEVFPRPKSGHYMNSLTGYRELRQRASGPGAEGLMFTPDGRLSEGITSNVFLILGGRLATPPPSAHILSGITRQAVIKLAQHQGIETLEADLYLKDLEDATAIFTTNSVRGITPISEIWSRANELCWEGNSPENGIVRRLLAAYADAHG